MNTPPRPAASERLLSLLERHWPWLAFAGVALVLLDLLTPILTPFVLGAALAYLGDPLVDRLERLRLSRTVGAVIVFAVFLALMTLLLLLLAPLLTRQLLLMIHQIPEWIRWLQDVALPRLGIGLPAGVRPDADSLSRALAQHLQQAGGIATSLAAALGQSTPRVLGFIAQLLLIPVVTFYLLRDWDTLVAQVRRLIPPRWLPAADSFAREADTVLSAFIRGQLLVMLALAAIYSVGLSLAGLDAAIAVGIGAGLVSFVPYLGFITGTLVATLAMLVQTQGLFAPVLWVWMVFGIGQTLEATVLTPNLVGDRVGLHPVAVIFALLAGGELFGFAGVLLALPVAAVLMVLLRCARSHWLASPLYRGPSPPDSG
ncbi:MAG: AI-2E family transporter [Gammaproteobacteria bacterium]|nr:AI-2E family transporter [Gammaproteobacteria bacterium]